jgi:hypothetical protein
MFFFSFIILFYFIKEGLLGEYLYQMFTITTRKLVDTNRNTNKIFSLIDYNKFYQHNILSLYPSLKTDGTILSIYIKGITVKKEGIKK